MTWLKAILLAGAAISATCIGAQAQTWPSKAVKVIVPITAGSGIDVVGRAVSQRLQEEFGQPFVVENRAGAGTTTGIHAVASAPPDGYTILFASVAMTITPVTMAKLPYDVSRDLAGVIPLVNTPLIMVTPPGRYKDVADFIAKAKAANGAMNYASIGYGAAAHFTSELLALTAGFKAQMVSFRGTSEAMTEVVAGRMEFYFTPATTALGLIADKKLDALVTSSNKRVADLPSVPTTADAGLKNAQFDFWVGMLVPRQTPRDIVDALHAKALKITKDPAFRDQMAKTGGEVMDPLTPAQFDEFIKSEIERNRQIAKAAGIEAK